ncbi:TIR domain-containing protein [candidate division KSB1 bacterium]|nr:TIR domain-containing protein [candidate division KSB1 bacterium]
MNSEIKKDRFDVFLSYKSDDRAMAIKLKNDLSCYDVTVWLDVDEIKPGELVIKALERGLSSSNAMVLIVSPKAMESRWVELEYSRAFTLRINENPEFNLIPVIYRIAKLPEFLAGYNAVDFQDEAAYSTNVQRLVWGITGKKPPRLIDVSVPDFSSGDSGKVERQTEGNSVSEAVLWRLAYAFLRLEQLPSGGWARSLPMWYQRIKGDTEEGRSRGFDLRKIGGMNLTCVALLTYTRSLCSVIGKGKRAEEILNDHNSEAFKQLLTEIESVEERNKVAKHAIRYIQDRINMEGAIPDRWERNPDTDLHHTLLGIIVLLLSYFLSARHCDRTFLGSLQVMCRYLCDHGRYLKLKTNGRSDARRFEIYCAITFLKHLLDYDFFMTSANVARRALNNLKDILPKIRDLVHNENYESQNFLDAYPDPKNGSGFLLNLTFLWSLSGETPLEKDSYFTDLYQIHNNCDASGLVQCTLGGYLVDPDWGHTAEYWWANARCGAEPPQIAKAIEILFSQLRNHNVFMLTHGVSFSSALGICKPPTPAALQQLDSQVNHILNFGATERNLLSLILWIFHQEYSDVPLLFKEIDKDQKFLEEFPDGHNLLPTISDIKNLFITKLLPGFYIPSEAQKEMYHQWKGVVNKSILDTKQFFETKLSDYNTAINKNRQFNKKWFHLFNYLVNVDTRVDSWILDVGCGSGAHAINEFLPKGYRVHFYDCSSRILKRIKTQLVAGGFDKDKYALIQGSIEDLPNKLKSDGLVLKHSYKIIFADAVLFHVSKNLMPQILRSFHEILSNDGFLFANFKVNDHTLIGIDGRFFEFYANYDEIQRYIENAGFYVDDVTITSKTSSMYRSPYPTKWAHFICRKRVEN